MIAAAGDSPPMSTQCQPAGETHRYTNPPNSPQLGLTATRRNRTQNFALTVATCAARSALSAALHRLLAPGRHRLPGVHGLAAENRRPALRPLWRAGRLAGRPLPRVLGAPPRVRLGTGRRGVRPRRSRDRLRLEG